MPNWFEPYPGLDARFPAPGVDARFPAPGEDGRFGGASVPPVTTSAAMSSPAVVPEPGSTVTITKGTAAGAPVGGTLTLGGADVTGAATDTGPSLVYVIPGGITAPQALVFTPDSGAPISLTVYPPLSRASIYMDAGSAPLGNVTALTLGGSLAPSFTQATATYPASVMQSDGLLLNGNTLRWSGSAGPFSVMRIVMDFTLLGLPRSGTGTGGLLTINPNGAAPARFWSRHTITPLLQFIGPNAVTMSLQQQPLTAVGSRSVVACEISATTDLMSLIEPDGYDSGNGFSQQAALVMDPITITRLEIGSNANAKIHRLAVFLE